MESMNPVWWPSLLAAMLLFQFVAVPALLLRKNDLADVAWGPGFPLAAAAGVHWGHAGGWEALDLRAVVALALITIWSIRLFLHVGWRNLSHRTEDVRYNNWRRQWGKTWVWRSYLQVFVLQPLILYVFLLPVLLVLAQPAAPIGPFFFAGLLVWLFGFAFESVADEQLRRLKAAPQNRGRLMTAGLWSWSRHPNYFGEVTQWWGIWLLALELPFGWATVVSPLGVTYLILKVSGVSMLEDLMLTRPGFAEYAERTSEFIPLPPRKTEAGA